MLNEPNIDSPANIDAAKQYRDDREAYKKKVRKLAQKSLDSMWYDSLFFHKFTPYRAP